MSWRVETAAPVIARVHKPIKAQADPLVTPVIAPAFYWDFGPVSAVTSLSAAMICSAWLAGYGHGHRQPPGSWQRRGAPAGP